MSHAELYPSVAIPRQGGKKKRDRTALIRSSAVHFAKTDCIKYRRCKKNPLLLSIYFFFFLAKCVCFLLRTEFRAVQIMRSQVILLEASRAIQLAVSVQKGAFRVLLSPESIKVFDLFQKQKWKQTILFSLSILNEVQKVNT